MVVLGFLAMMAILCLLAVGFVWLLRRRFTSEQMARGFQLAAELPGPQLEAIADRLSGAVGDVAGPEALVGKVGVVSRSGPTDLWVSLSGETWRAATDALVEVGDSVEVTQVDGLVLQVQRVDTPGGGA